MTAPWRHPGVAVVVLAGALGALGCTTGKQVAVSVALGVPARSQEARTLPPQVPSPRPVPGAPIPGTLDPVEHVSLAIVTGAQHEDGTAGGLACVAEVRGRVVLFAAGSAPAGLERKLTTVGRDASQIRLVVAADAEALETVRWLDAATDGQTRVFVPAGALPESALGDRLEEVATPVEVSPEVFATGLLALGSPTQAMAIRTSWGWIAFTGCGGPDTDQVVDRMLSTLGKPLTWLVGGIHGGRWRDPDGAADLAARLRSLGVQRVAAAPCTSAAAREALRQAFGANLLEVPAGAVTTFKP